MRRDPIRLPVDGLLPELVQRLRERSAVILRAAPGSGKTTRVPPALLDAFSGQILVLEPRRLAAKHSARRVAQERGEEVGRTVGYQFRFENVGGPSTRLRFVTEGMLMRKLMDDPRLSGVSCIVLDEFHERHLHTDLAAACLRALRDGPRPDLKLVLMSATLDTDRVSAFLGGCPVLEVEARPHPVTVHHLTGSEAKPLERRVREAVLRALEETFDDGDILVFLPGMAEIRRCERELAESLDGARAGPLVLPLHGELSREDQDRAIERSERRKIILSTNVAETSLTIEGVTTVIDSGLHRMAAYSWWSGVPSLRTLPISRASAVQRAGRAGRTAPGRCFRLYSAADLEGRPAFDTPEILRADLAQTLLELKIIGESDPTRLAWLDPPPPAALEAAAKLLHLLGATASPALESALTDAGRRLAALPVHPRLGRILLEARALACLDDAATLVCWLSEGGPAGTLDALELLRLPMSETQKKLRSQLLSLLRDPPARRLEPAWLATREARLAFSLLSGFPDRVSRRRKPSSGSTRAGSAETELLFATGGSAPLEESATTLSSEYFVTLDLRETRRQAEPRPRLRVSLVCAIDMDWLAELEPSLLEDREELRWDAERSRVLRDSRLAYGELTLEQSSRPAEPSPLAARVLVRSALAIAPETLPSLAPREWVQALSRVADAESIEAAFARALLLRKHRPELAGEFGASEGFARLTALFETRTSRAELTEADLPSEILAALVPDALGALERLLPETLLLPGGRRARIHYAREQPPWVASRLQDFFGMRAAPALLDGRLPLTLHLLAPNQRAVQITTDLEGFWQRGYREQRHALSRRYPRHAWPEDPLAPHPKKS